MSARWSAAARLTAWAWLSAVLASAALSPLVANQSFLFAGAFAAALVATTGALGRIGHFPAALMVPLQLLVLLEWLTFTYARAEALGGVIPTGASMALLADFVRDALETARLTVPPAPVNTAVTACLAAIVALVALVVDLLAVTWRRPALVGLAFLGVYMAPVSLLAGNVPVAAFVPGAVGYVFLLAAEQRDRLSHWGRHITGSGSLMAGSTRSVPTVTSLVSAGRRVGFGAVALAVVLPLLVPTLPRTLLGDGPLSVDGDGSGSGNGDGVEVENPMLDMKRNLGPQSEEVLLRVTTDDPDPGYLRLAALDTFNEDSWEPGPRDDETMLEPGQTPIVPGLGSDVAFTRVDYDVAFTDEFESSWLPTTYPVSDVSVDDEWGIDAIHLDVTARDSDPGDVGTYEFSALQVTPTRDQLTGAFAPPAALQAFVELPEGLPSEISQLARDVTSDAETSIDRALALQEWFRESGGFRYTTVRQAGDSMETIENFLTVNRSGYCEQFAGSMALMARTLGIPSRVAVGFLRPEEVGDGQYEYRGEDMHAWPELYFDGVGWLRFEPTPGVRTGADAPTYAAGAGSGETTAPQGTDATSQAPDGSTRAPVESRGVDAASGSAGDGGGPWSLLAGVSLAVLVLVALALAPRLLRAGVRRRRWSAAAGEAGAAEPAWQELRDSTVDLGLPFDDKATVRVAGRAVRMHLGPDTEAVDALNRLVVGVERSRFAPRSTGPRPGGRPERVPAGGQAGDEAVADSGSLRHQGADPAAERVRADVEAVLAALAAGRNRRRLWRATWLPVSLLRRPAGSRRRGWSPGRGVVTRDGGVVQVEGTATR